MSEGGGGGECLCEQRRMETEMQRPGHSGAEWHGDGPIGREGRVATGTCRRRGRYPARSVDFNFQYWRLDVLDSTKQLCKVMFHGFSPGKKAAC